jgi:HK97 family phage prohead protease
MQVQSQESLDRPSAYPGQFDGAGRYRSGGSMLTKWCSQALPDAAERSAGSPGSLSSPGSTDGPVTCVLSTDDVDRHGDVVAADGWVLDSYRKNPVLLWAHDYRHPAIGRAIELWTEPHRLLAKMEFAPSEFAQEVAGLYRSGFQWGVSVGFKPLRFEERRDEKTGAYLGVRFLEQELLEVSAVPVPANRNALRRGKGNVNLAVDPAAIEAVWPVLAGQVDELSKLAEELINTMGELESAMKSLSGPSGPELTGLNSIAEIMAVLREARR